MKKITIGLAVSGNLGYQTLVSLSNTHDIVCVFTNRKSTNIREFCEDNNLPVFIGNPRGGKTASFIKNLSYDILLSVNYLFIIEIDMINSPNKCAVNLHGSLLPKYRGRTPHVWAIINNEQETGVTAHRIVEGLDAGDILFQERIKIEENDTGASILSKYIKVYGVLIHKILEGLKNNTLRSYPQKEELATYFGKRTPDDGQIIFSWQRERIRNWVRAQAKPYPGAFFLFKGKKVIVHFAQYSDFGFKQEDENGKIVFVGNHSIGVKTPNGVIEFSEIEEFSTFNFFKNTILK